ncbi:MAG: VWA domain-containing protein [Cellvibrionaceae bacterium]
MLTLAYPLLLLLLPLPWLVRKILKPAPVQEGALKVPFFNHWQQLSTNKLQAPNSSKVHLSALWIIWLLLILASTKPQWVGDPVSLPASGRDLLLAVDLSDSMKAVDMKWKGQQVTRLNMVKAVVSDFVRRRENDRLGLVLFGTNAYLQAPLTFDRETVGQLLKEAQRGFAGDYTAIGDAIGLSIKRLQNRPDNHRVLILLTDGSNSAGKIDPKKAADLAAQAGVKIYTIGVGADSMEVPIYFGLASKTYNPSIDLDEDTLKYIAKKTGGEYFRARSTEDLMEIYKLLDSLEPIEQDAETFRPTSDLFYWPLSIAMFFAVLLLLAQSLIGRGRTI